MRVAFLDPLEERLRDFPAEYLAADDEVLVAETAGELPHGWETAEAVVWWDTPVDRALIEQMPALRFMQRVGWFRARGDSSYAVEQGIPVAVTPFGVADRVAQHGFTLTMMLLRRMHVAIDALERRLNPDELEERAPDTGQNTINWARIEGIQSLNDKTVGILGFGEIGSCYARMLSPYHTRTLAHRRRPLTPEQEAFYQVESASLDDLLRESDIVVSFVPGIPEAEGMMGEREFGLMKPSAYFVNCGRARSVDDEALLSALREQRIAGAGLDVFSIEPLPRNSAFRELDNAIITPHSAGGIGGWTDTFARLRANLDRVRDGRGDAVTIAMRPGDYQPD
ncbi:MAG: NAD(P)-dependent oxidoreductase [Dehalococcoidia bacterium]